MKKIFNLHTFTIILSIAGIIAIFMIRRMDPVKTERMDGVAMDTVIRLTASAAKSRPEIRRILEDTYSLIKSEDKILSMHNPDSETSAIGAASGREPVRVSGATYAALAAALAVADLTDGAFDPTVGPVSVLWQKYLDDGKIPPDEEIQSALAKVGYAGLKLSAPDSAFLGGDGALDMGGVAKGYVSASARNLLRSAGITSALIDLGGNVVAMGGRVEKGRTEREPWVIGVQHPSKPRGAPICVIRLHEGSVITAGDYERFWNVGGHRYTHIIDPATGRPLEGTLRSVTIVSDDPAQGDALSTAFMVMGESRALELLRIIPNCDAIFISEENGRLRVLATSGLRDSLEPAEGGGPIYFYDVQ
jgi:thiamine biosynthesis lipoprotein